jgi:hypothetical protein
MQASRETPPVAHVTRFDVALGADPAAAAALATLCRPSAGSGAADPAPSEDPGASAEALCVALWIGLAAGALPPGAAAAMAEAVQVWRDTEARGMAGLIRAAAGEEGRLARQARRDLRRATAAWRAGRLAAMAGWADLAVPPPGPGASEENAAQVLALLRAPAAGRMGGGAAQRALGDLVDAAELAMTRAVADAHAAQEAEDAPDPFARAALDGPAGDAAFHGPGSGPIDDG